MDLPLEMNPLSPRDICADSARQCGPLPLSPHREFAQPLFQLPPHPQISPPPLISIDPLRQLRALEFLDRTHGAPNPNGILWSTAQHENHYSISEEALAEGFAAVMSHRDHMERLNALKGQMQTLEGLRSRSLAERHPFCPHLSSILRFKLSPLPDALPALSQ